MGGLFPSQGPTAFDAITSAAAAALYLAVGAAALISAPRDSRTRVFFVTAIASLAPYTATTLAWMRGANAVMTRPVVGLVIVSLIVGSLALLHFMQVFPWRRPWIQRYGLWLTAGYAALPSIAALAIWKGPGIETFIAPQGYPDFSGIDLVLLLFVALPMIVLVGIVIPFAGLLSLYKTWSDAKRYGVESTRVTTFWILISQLAGGVLTILVIPLLDVVLRPGWWTTATAALLFAFALLMPVAFAVGVWKYRVLDLDPSAYPDAVLPHHAGQHE